MDGGDPARVQRVRHDSALGSWFVDLRPPSPDLTDHVELLWYGEGRVRYQRDRILPSGGAFLLINLGPTQYRVDADGRRIAFDDIWYSGPHTGPIDTEAPQGNALLGVALSPCGSHAWLDCAAHALAERTLSLTDVLGDAARALRDRLLSLRDSAARFAAVEAWLRQRLHPRRQTHAVVRWAVQRIATSGGQVGVATLARESGFSRKHLAALFSQQVGLGPKALARVQRFRSALALLDGAGSEVPWSKLASRCGYFDQAHLSRDFRHFCGFAPGEFLRHARADATSIVLR